MATTAKREAFNFFFRHAGYSVGQGETKRQGRARCARQLAAAERDARSLGYTFEWHNDQEGCIGCDCGVDSCVCSSGEPHECLVCLMFTPSEDGNSYVVQSLGSICETSREYRRVVEAELALEQLA